MHNPPGEGNSFKVAPNAPEELKHKERILAIEDPEINPWACIILLLLTVGVMAVTVQFVSNLALLQCQQVIYRRWQLVSSIESVRETTKIQEE